MTESGYSGPPSAGEPVDPNGQTGWGAPPYGQAPYAPTPYGNPYAQYPAHGPNPWGQNMPYPYPPYGYGPPPSYNTRPSSATAAGVLGWINAGLLIIAAVLLFVGSSVANDLRNTGDGSSGQYTGELATDGVLNLIAAGLLIAGGIMLTGRSVRGRLVYSAGATLVLALCIYWLVRWIGHHDIVGFVFWTIVFAALTIVGVSLAWTSGVTRWLTPLGSPAAANRDYHR